MTEGWKRPLQLAVACWIAFAGLLIAAYWLPFAQWADGWAVQGFLNLQKPVLNDVAAFVARLANPAPYAVWTLALVAIALYRRRPRHALAVIVLLGGANLITQTLKVLLTHPRPHAFLGHAQISPEAFPSGHATASMALALAAVLVAPHAWRPTVAVIGALYSLAVSESIMLLCWHFPSDVAGGYLAAASSAMLTLAALRAAEQRWPRRTAREAARRVIEQTDQRRAAFVGAGFFAAAVLGLAIAAGPSALHYADRHTVAVGAALTIAVMASALPMSVAAIGARRS